MYVANETPILESSFFGANNGGDSQFIWMKFLDSSANTLSGHIGNSFKLQINVHYYKDQTQTQRAVSSSSPFFAKNMWHHFCITVDGNGTTQTTISLYRNGEHMTVTDINTTGLIEILVPPLGPVLLTVLENGDFEHMNTSQIRLKCVLVEKMDIQDISVEAAIHKLKYTIFVTLIEILLKVKFDVYMLENLLATKSFIYHLIDPTLPIIWVRCGRSVV